MILSTLCTAVAQVLAASGVDRKIEGIVERAAYDGERYPMDENSDIVFMQPRCFTESSTSNERLIDFDSMWEVVESMVDDFSMNGQFRKNRKSSELLMRHLHKALVAVGATNIDLINLLTIISHNHNLLTRFNLSPGTEFRGSFRRGLTGIPSRLRAWALLDKISNKGVRNCYYSQNSHELDSPTEESVLAEVRLYKTFFSQVDDQPTDSLPHILLSYSFNSVFGFKGCPSCTVYNKEIRSLLKQNLLDKDYLTKFNECYRIYVILREGVQRLHDDGLSTLTTP